MNKIFIRYIPFPDEIHGHVFGLVKEQNNRFLILIDNRIEAEMQDSTLRHELAHIALKHFDDTLPFDDVIRTGSFGDEWEEREIEADNLAGQMQIDDLWNLCNNA